MFGGSAAEGWVMYKLPGEDSQKLCEMTKDEFRSVANRLAPSLTDEEYDDMWERFCEAKRMKEMQ